MDRFRIRALEKIIAWSGLHPEYRRAAVRTLLEKADVLARGAEKRGQGARAEAFRAKQRRFESLLADPYGAPAAG